MGGTGNMGGGAGNATMSAGRAGAAGNASGAGGGGGSGGAAGSAASGAGGAAGGASGAGGAGSNCGNGSVEAPEQCDTSGKSELCSADCAATVPLRPLGCSNVADGGGVPVHVFDTEVTVEGNTALTGPTVEAQLAQPDCDQEAVQLTKEANDVVFQVIPHLSGKLLIRLDPTFTQFDTVLYARTGNCTGTVIRCEDPESPDSGEAMQLDVTSAEPLWVVVDGFGEDHRGPFQLHFLFTETTGDASPRPSPAGLH